MRGTQCSGDAPSIFPVRIVYFCSLAINNGNKIFNSDLTLRMSDARNIFCILTTLCDRFWSIRMTQFCSLGNQFYKLKSKLNKNKVNNCSEIWVQEYLYNTIYCILLFFHKDMDIYHQQTNGQGLSKFVIIIIVF